MTLILDSIFSSVAYSHLIVDLLNGTRAILLAYLSGPLGLTNASLALVSTIYVISAALIGPIFGYLADRVGVRWIVAGGVLWMGVFFSLALLTPGRLALLFLIFASLGSGAYHPAGTTQATLSGRSLLSGKETTASSYFFLFGQIGLFIGPMVGGLLLDAFGPLGLLLIVAPAFPMGMVAARTLAALPVPVPSTPLRLSLSGIKFRQSALPLLGFGLLAAFQSWTQQNMVTFVPKYLSDLGQTASFYGLSSALFMGGSAVGNVAGGMLADRYGKRRVAMLALALGSVPLLLVPVAGQSPLLFGVLLVAGLFTGSVYSIIVVTAQRMVPGGMGVASGLILGFMFSSGAIGTYISGHLADLYGFVTVFRMTALIILTAAALTWVIPENEGGRIAG
jgi:MFS transporter, FSR family, fosmidomycin resistance protein